MITITACGSGKFKPLVHGICSDLTSAGFVVLAPPLHDMRFVQDLNAEQSLLVWKGATFKHFQRVANSSVCLMVNPGGYLGLSSTLELGYAVAMHKLVIALQHDPEPAREAVFDIVLETEVREEIVPRLIDMLPNSVK